MYCNPEGNLIEIPQKISHKKESVLEIFEYIHKISIKSLEKITKYLNNSIWEKYDRENSNLRIHRLDFQFEPMTDFWVLSFRIRHYVH